MMAPEDKAQMARDLAAQLPRPSSVDAAGGAAHPSAGVSVATAAPSEAIPVVVSPLGQGGAKLAPIGIDLAAHPLNPTTSVVGAVLAPIPPAQLPPVEGYVVTSVTPGSPTR